VKLGVYYHYVGSLHLYAKHLERARKVLEDTTWLGLEMPPLSDPKDLRQFLAAERALRLGASEGVRFVSELPEFWKQLAEVLACYSLTKKGNDSALSLAAISKGSSYRNLLFNLADERALIHK